MPFSRVRDGLPVSDFSELHAAIHLAHKYQCADVETRALSLLKKLYSPHFADHSPSRSPTCSMTRPPRTAAIAAVNIARLTGTPSMLPFALYQACTLEGEVLDGYARRDGSVEHLAALDLRLCMDARSELARELAAYVRDVFAPGHSDGCEDIEQCTMGLNDMRDDAELRLGRCDVFDAYEGRAVEHWVGNYELCAGCTREVLAREEGQRRRVWKLLPEMFGMTAQECGFTHQ